MVNNIKLPKVDPDLWGHTLESEYYTQVEKEGIRHDEGKPQISLVPPESINALASVLTKSIVRYEPRNWEKGMDWSRCYDSLQRHLIAWWGGQDKDPDSGLSHLWHALANLTFLVTYEQRGRGRDNRPKEEVQLPPTT